MAVADFNRDGILDLVVANAGSSRYSQDGNVTVLLGNGDGTFQPPVPYTAGGHPMSVAVADLNADGIPDLIVPNGTSNDVSVLLGTGDGGFQAAATYAVGPYGQSGNSTPAVAVSDFNGDGIPDFAVVFGGGVRLFLGNGDGTFQTSADSYVGGSCPWAIAVGDFNGDGLLDLVLATDFSVDNQGLSILFNDGKWGP